MVLRDLPVVGNKLQLTEVVFLGLLALSLIIIRDTRRFVHTPLTGWLAAWLVAAGVSAALSGHVRPSLLELAAWGYLAAVYLIIVNTVTTWREWRGLVTVWIVASSVTAALVVIGAACGGLWDLATPFAVRFESISVMRDPFWVGVGFLWASATPNMVVGYLLAGSLLALAVMATSTGRARWWAAAAAAVHAVALSLTVSRGLTAVGLALLVFLLQFRSYAAELGRWVLVAGWLLLVVVIQTLSFYLPATFSIAVQDVQPVDAAPYRAEYYGHLQPEEPVRRLRVEAIYAPFTRPFHYRAALQMWAERPWLGVGPGSFGEELYERQHTQGERWNGLAVYAPYDPHSTYLGALAEIGLIGALGVVAILAVAIVQAFDAIRRSTLSAPLLWAVLGVLAGYAFSALDDDLLTKRWFWVIAGLGGSAYALVRSERDYGGNR